MFVSGKCPTLHLRGNVLYNVSMGNISAFGRIKELEIAVTAKLAVIDIYDAATEERKIITALRRELTDARLDVRDYDLSDTRAEQLQNAKAAKDRLDHVRRLILQASEHNIFSSVDVAQLTAELEHITDNLS
jgi:hypothetical protein